MDIFSKCHNFTDAKEVIKAGHYPYFIPMTKSDGTVAEYRGHKLIMCGSNNYLGLTTHPDVRKAAKDAITLFGTSCTGSRFLNGTLELHEQLERELADWVGKPTSLVFATGMQVNLGTISALLGRQDVVILDKHDHASIVDGARLSWGRIERFQHNDMEDLDRVLAEIPTTSGKMVIVDGVFSMEGDLSNLPEIVRLKNKYNTRLLVDDAHGVGVHGEKGRGTCEHFGLLGETDIIMGTFSKAFASLGGFVVANHDVITHIKHRARALIFSASMVPASVACAQTALDIIKSEPERRKRLWDITERVLKGFSKIGLDTGDSQTPVIPVIIGEDERCFAFWKTLITNGIFSNPVISPATPPGRALIRTSYMATHTDEDIDIVLDVFDRCSQEFELVKK